MKTLRILGLVAALALVGCDSYFHAPAGEPARIGVTFPQIVGGAGGAFDAADNVAVEVQVNGVTLHAETVPVTPAGSAAIAEVLVELPEGATAAQLRVDLRTGSQTLFTGSASVNLVPGQVAEATVPLEPVVATLDLTGPPPFTTLGQSVPLDGRALFASGHEVPGIAVSWESLDPAVVTVNLSPQGWQATAVADGSATLRAAGGGQIATVPAQVLALVASIEVVPGALELRPGETARLTALLHDAGGSPIAERPVEWSSSDTAVAVVDAEGEVTARAPGVASIQADFDGAAGLAQLRVIPPGPAVETLEAVQITAQGAVLRARIHSHGEAATLQFTYSLSPDLVEGDSTAPIAIAPSASAREVGQPITGLPSGSRIYYRASATNGVETALGEILHFDTPSVPGIPTDLVGSLGHGVRLTWIAHSTDETRFEIEREVVWSGPEGPPQPSPAGPASVFEALGTTPAGVTFFDDVAPPVGELRYRVRGCHDLGCSPWSEPLVWFYGLPPAVETLTPGVLNSETVRLNALVNPHSAPTTIYWEVAWDPNFVETMYVPSVNEFDPAPLPVGAGSDPLGVQHIANLYPTVWYIRAVASNTWGTTYGQGITLNMSEGW